MPDDVFAQIVAAASDARAWYTCPNGHRYAIGNCGKAMEKAKCVECGAPIGGTAHKLTGDNRALGYLNEVRSNDMAHKESDV
jgi:hypothetical protein